MKYCVIPFTANKGDVCDFAMTVSFQSAEKYVKLFKPYSKDCILNQIPSVADIEKWRKTTSLMASIKLPYNLDSFINKRDSKPNKNKDSISENVRMFYASEATFEDEAFGLNSGGITAEDLAEMDSETIQKMLLGVDLDEEEEELNSSKKSAQEQAA